MRPARIVLSSNNDPKYLEFWPLTAYAWAKLFNVEVYLALLVEDCDPDSLYGILPLEKYGTVVPYRLIKEIPSSNQAKIARYHLASTWNDDSVIMTNDIDLVPLQCEYADNLFKQRPAGHLMLLGSELYTGVEQGKAMAGYLTAESRVWRSLFNPNELDWLTFARSFIGLRVFDHKEDVNRNVHHEDPDTFSDESLVRALLKLRPVPTVRLPLGFYPYTQRALCRSNWQFDPEKLKNGTYVEAHMPRPWSQHEEKIQPLVEWIEALK